MGIMISKVRIQNFRSFENIEVDLKSTNILIGQNNCGKTNFLKALDRELKSILTELSVKQRKVIEDFIDKKEWIADKECLYLYIQGAKDVIALLKKLGVF